MYDETSKSGHFQIRPEGSLAPPRKALRKRDGSGESAASVSSIDASGLKFVCVNGSPVPGPGALTGSFQLQCKRYFDLVLAILALVLLSPVFVAAAIAIKLTSPGPVFFAHRRAGRYGVPISVLKFRSMHHVECDAQSCIQTVLNDPRITSVGDFLRRTSIDELPQVFNVIKGEMSWVGPRPHAIDMRAAAASYRILVPNYSMRLAMRPGITGWAQANGLRGEVRSREAAIARVEHDIAYIQNFSLLLDLRILARTLVCEFIFGTGR